MTVSRNISDAASFGLDPAGLAAFCQTWEVQELALFGSGVRGDLRPGSDLDFLVTFLPDARWTLLDHVRMERELTEIVGRKVDLVSRRGLERSANWIRRKAIFEEARPVYATG
jgi:predicted nucleotidyltransferase